MMEKYDWILFDLDGTLWDHSTASANAVKKLCARFDFPVDRMVSAFHDANETVWRELEAGLIDFDRLRVLRFERIAADLGINGHEPEDLSDFYLARYLDHPTWLDGAHEVVRSAAGLARLAVLTNAPHRTQDVKMTHLGPESGCFEAVICADDVHALKPAAEFFLRGASILGIKDGDRVLMIGDSWDGDMATPKSFGWDTAWISHGRDIPENSGETLIFRDLAELNDFLTGSNSDTRSCSIDR